MARGQDTYEGPLTTAIQKRRNHEEGSFDEVSTESLMSQIKDIASQIWSTFPLKVLWSRPGTTQDSFKNALDVLEDFRLPGPDAIKKIGWNSTNIPGEDGSALQNQTGSTISTHFRPLWFDLQPQSALQKVVRFKKKTSCQKEEKKPVRSK